MKTISPAQDHETQAWIMADRGDGILRCVCGYTLRKMDNNIWRCDGGNHQYSFDEGTVCHDKFGNVMLNPKSHEKETVGGGEQG